MRAVRKQTLRIIMAADRLVWLARPSRKCPERGRERTVRKRLESAVLIAFAWLLQSSIVYRRFFLRNLSFRSYLSLESALIAQKAQKVRDGQTDPRTKRINWRPYGYTLEALWLHTGGLMATHWRPYGYTLEALWLHTGATHCIEALWLHTGGPMGSTVHVGRVCCMRD